MTARVTMDIHQLIVNVNHSFARLNTSFLAIGSPYVSKTTARAGARWYGMLYAWGREVGGAGNAGHQISLAFEILQTTTPPHQPGPFGKAKQIQDNADFGPTLIITVSLLKDWSSSSAQNLVLPTG